MMLDFFNLVLAWNIVPSDWKSSEVVPVFKHGDRTIWLKLFQRLVYGAHRTQFGWTH